MLSIYKIGLFFPTDPDRKGYYVYSKYHDNPDKWQWHDFGRGSELVEDGVYGPFRNHQHAAEFRRELT